MCFFSLFVFGQHYNFKNYTIEDGLAQSQVFSVLEDSRGYLWVGTYGGGVSRFDGNTFVNFSTKDGLCDNVINEIFEDSNGYLWFSTDSGLNRYDGRTFVVYTQKDGLPQDFTGDILEDSDGLLWVGTYDGGVGRFDGKKFTTITKMNGLVDNQVRALFQDQERNIWIGTLNGLSIYNGKEFIQTPLTQKLAGYWVYDIICTREGNTWVATNQGVFCFDGKEIKHFREKDGLANEQVVSIIQDQEGLLWLGTHNGLFCYNGKMFSSYTSRDGLVQDRVRSLAEDREGNIWIGTDAGLSQFRGRMFFYFGLDDGLKNDCVWGFWEDVNGRFWISTEKGISIYDKRTRSFLETNEPFLQGINYPLVQDRNRNLWFGNSETVIKYDGQQFIDFNKVHHLPPCNVYCIFEDRNRSIWIGTEAQGIYLYDGKQVTNFKEEKLVADNSINTIAQDRAGNIWIGTNNGLAVYNGRTFTYLNTEQPWLKSRYINTIIEDRNGSIWIATYGAGLIKHTPGKTIGQGSFVSITTDDGLTDDEIQLMTFDNNGNIWLGTNKGVTRLDVKKLEQTGQKALHHYGKAEGFFGIECNQNAVYKDKHGRLWFGTVKGAYCLNPELEKKISIDDRVRITNLKLFYNPFNLSEYTRDSRRAVGTDLLQGLELPYNKNHLTFEYIAISLTAPGKVRYQVKLEGFDQNWSPVSPATYTTYSNLPPGDYVFKVKASNSLGIWAQTPTLYQFSIRTPLWGSSWFYMFIVVLVGGIGLGLYKLRVRSLKRSQRELEAKIQEHTLALKLEKQKVEQINRELEQRVEERTRKLAVANQKLIRAQKLEAIGTLAGGVAHDLNNVLAGLVSYPELLLMRISQDDSLYRIVTTIKKSGEKAAAIVQDLLALARRNISISEVINLNHIIIEFLESPEFEKIISYHAQVHVETRLDDLLPNISGSPVHISKALMNLISNAAEAMSNSGIITIYTYSLKLSKPLNGYDEIVYGDYAVLQVTDTGCGISPDAIDHIFEPFYSKKKLGRSGTGLGMAVVWGTVEDHKGYITVQSTEGKGTTFHLYFPVCDKQLTMPMDYFTSTIELKGNGQSILVIDDVEEQREAATLMLEQLGYSVHSVSSGEDAVAYVKNNPVDILVLDMLMEPGLNGLETFKQVIQLFPNQKAIIVSGYSETPEVKEVERLGAGFFLKKPFGLVQLGQAIKECLNTKQANNIQNPDFSQHQEA